jgi:MbtH protein
MTGWLAVCRAGTETPFQCRELNSSARPRRQHHNTAVLNERRLAVWDDKQLKVVINDEEQYSIWPVDRENAPGWRDAGKSGTKEECLAYIEQVWTDMRPLSLRKAMAEKA